MAISQDILDTRILKFLDRESTREIGEFGLAMLENGYAASTTYSYICCIANPQPTKIGRAARQSFEQWKSVGLNPDAPKGQYGPVAKTPRTLSVAPNDSISSSFEEVSEDEIELPPRGSEIILSLKAQVKAAILIEESESFSEAATAMQWELVQMSLRSWFDLRSELNPDELLTVSVMLILCQDPDLKSDPLSEGDRVDQLKAYLQI